MDLLPLPTKWEKAIRQYAGTNTLDPADIASLVPIATKQYYNAVLHNQENGIPVPSDAGAFIRANLVFARTDVAPDLYEGASTERINTVSNRVNTIAQLALEQNPNIDLPAEAIRSDFLNRTQQAFYAMRDSNDKTVKAKFKQYITKGAKAASKSGYELTPYIWFLENVTSPSPTGDTSNATTARNEIKQFYKDWANGFVSDYNKDEDNKKKKNVILK